MVQHDVELQGVVSQVPRQIDVLVRGTVGRSELTIAIECKRYKRKLGIGMIDEFVVKLHDLEVDRGVLFWLAGYTSGAMVRAAKAVHPKIELHQFPKSGHLDVD